MRMNFLKTKIVSVAVFALSVMAFAEGLRPVDIYIPEIVYSGSAQLCVISVEGQGVAHLSSIPQGVVDVNVPVVSGSNLVSIPFSPNFVGPVTVYATMDGNSQIVGTTTLVMPG